MGYEVEQIGDCTLYRADCMDIFSLLGPFDSMATDPPYGVGLKGKRGHYRNNPSAKRTDTYVGYDDTEENFQTMILPRLRQAISLCRCAAVCMADRHIWALPPGHLGGFYLPQGCGMGPWGFQCFMHIVFYGKDPYLASGQGSRPNGRYGLYGNDANHIDHPCAKPLAAMQWIIHRISFQGQTLLDPFMGSGTTGVACVQLGRSFIGIEIEPRYFDLACRRIEAAYAQGDLFRPAPSVQPKQEVLL